MIENNEDLSIDEILASIRNVLWENQVEKNASRSRMRDYAKERDGDVFELKPHMLAKGWDIPYEYANWDFNDVAVRILHKYSEFFAAEETNARQENVRVMVKKDN